MKLFRRTRANNREPLIINTLSYETKSQSGFLPLFFYFCSLRDTLHFNISFVDFRFISIAQHTKTRLFTFQFHTLFVFPSTSQAKEKKIAYKENQFRSTLCLIEPLECIPRVNQSSILATAKAARFSGFIFL